MTVHRMTAAQVQQELASVPSKNKYGARRTTVDGITFDSDREARRYCELRVLAKAGKIRDLKLQVPIMLEGQCGPVKSRTGRQMRLTVDFSYVDADTGLRVFEDAKGKPTRDYEVRRGVAAAQGVEVVEV
ncbi:hypothetical protein GCM10016455_05700 [Aliiroseovarius zhejiangensis]|uniref:DUF1064 domain-containing protein n=1 Tax=Aliiroseovarius zhejiangensis TaxID=1632025 RepID=A0ABQ3IP54_9RHOB|nr:DUF1064 domain-containing protein [Aliiroseovarius zhejiangensis]GHE88427.1 hypothetical protein GCM10016455_05700 [Aliiroseovarius zhejiangensis]